jgi:hypothetical protein
MSTGDAVTRQATSLPEPNGILLAAAQTQKENTVRLAQAQPNGNGRYVFDGSRVLNTPMSPNLPTENPTVPAASGLPFNQQQLFRPDSTVGTLPRTAPVPVPNHSVATSSGDFICNDNSYTCQSAMRMMDGYRREQAARGLLASMPDWGLEIGSSVLSNVAQMARLQSSAVDAATLERLAPLREAYLQANQAYRQVLGRTAVHLSWYDQDLLTQHADSIDNGNFHLGRTAPAWRGEVRGPIVEGQMQVNPNSFAAPQDRAIAHAYQQSAGNFNAVLQDEVARARLRTWGTLGLGIVGNAVIDRTYFPNDRPSWLTVGADMTLPLAATFMPGRVWMKAATMIGGHSTFKYFDHEAQKDGLKQELEVRWKALF